VNFVMRLAGNALEWLIWALRIPLAPDGSRAAPLCQEAAVLAADFGLFEEVVVEAAPPVSEGSNAMSISPAVTWRA
jgi:hypothetical protein